jgi:hypothetical protein
LRRTVQRMGEILTFVIASVNTFVSTIPLSANP